MPWEWINESDVPDSQEEPRKDKETSNQVQVKAQEQEREDEGEKEKSSSQLAHVAGPSTSATNAQPSPLSSNTSSSSSLSFEHFKELILTQTQQVSELKQIVENQRVMIDQLVKLAVSDKKSPSIEPIQEQCPPSSADCLTIQSTMPKAIEQAQEPPAGLAPYGEISRETAQTTPPVPTHNQSPNSTTSDGSAPPSQPQTTSVDHIDPPAFYGHRSKARAWLSDYDCIMDINGYDNFQKLIIAEAYMAGEARDWYNRALNKNPRLNWAGFKEHFLRNFCAVDEIIRNQADPPRPPSRVNENPICGALRMVDGFVKQVFDSRL